MIRMKKEDLREAWELTDGKCWFCGQKLHPFADWGALIYNTMVIPECSDCKRMRRGRNVEEFRKGSFAAMTKAGFLLEWAAARTGSKDMKHGMKAALDNLFSGHGNDTFPFYGETEGAQTYGSIGQSDEVSEDGSES